MSTEWKPGDVAVIKFSAGDEVGMWIGDRWAVTGDRSQLPNYLVSHRLVVIDAEDREQVGRLVDLWGANEHLDCGSGSCAVDTLQTALREYANPKPPRPEEPTGLGAVVEDADGNRWVRDEADDPRSWYRRGVPACLHYSDIAAVRVLSEGVQP